MGVARIWFLWSLAALMMADELMVLVAFSRHSGFLSWNLAIAIPLMLTITGIPYVTAATPTLAYSKEYSASLWVLAIGMLLVAGASLFYRMAELYIAEDARAAALQGRHYMNCGPPARLAILLVDYFGTLVVIGSAGLVLMAQLGWRRYFRPASPL